MTILLTGGGGFIGSHVADFLLNKGAEIVIYELDIKNCHRISDKSRFTFFEADLLNNESIDEVFQKYKPSVVIHLGWVGITGKERNNSSQVKNILATQHLLEMAGKYKIELFIGMGSQAEYGVYNKRISEDILPKPDNLYGLYKLSAGLLGKFYAQKYGYKYAWLRLFSTFGPNLDMVKTPFLTVLSF